MFKLEDGVCDARVPLTHPTKIEVRASMRQRFRAGLAGLRRPRASLGLMPREASATLLHLWLLPRSGVQLNTEKLAEALYVDVKTVENARSILEHDKLLRLSRAHDQEPYRYHALQKKLYPGWRRERVDLPAEMADLRPTAKAVYLYLYNKPGLTRSQLADQLNLRYRGVQDAMPALEPWLKVEGERPAYYEVSK